MPPLPEIFFGLSPAVPVRPGDERWRSPLPLSRQAFLSLKEPAGENTCPVRYGDYFSAVERFLRRDEGRSLMSALSARDGSVAAGDIESIHVFLEKHGAYYHPARVEISLKGRRTSLVLNVAVAPPGRHILDREYRLLQALGKRPGGDCLPAVYARGQETAEEGQTLSMFLGEWFEGFHEFHLTPGAPEAGLELGVWDPRVGLTRLPAEAQTEVYRQAARILTAFFDPATTCRIFPWSHAAGDFVVRSGSNGPAVKLITVRNYVPMMEPPPEDSAAILEALLIFFLDLGVRMRLDRIDGVGSVAWAGTTAVAGTLEGFFQGLAEQPPLAALRGAPLAEIFWDYLTAWPGDDLYAYAQSLMAQLPRRAPETPLVEKHLGSHLEAVFGILHAS